MLTLLQLQQEFNLKDKFFLYSDESGQFTEVWDKRLDVVGLDTTNSDILIKSNEPQNSIYYFMIKNSVPIFFSLNITNGNLINTISQLNIAPSSSYVAKFLHINKKFSHVMSIMTYDNGFYVFQFNFTRNMIWFYKSTLSEMNFMHMSEGLYFLGGKSLISNMAQFNIVLSNLTSVENKLIFEPQTIVFRDLSAFNATLVNGSSGISILVPPISVNEYIMSINKGDYIQNANETYFNPFYLPT